jgi:hypothetical protein
VDSSRSQAAIGPARRTLEPHDHLPATLAREERLRPQEIGRSVGTNARLQSPLADGDADPSAPFDKPHDNDEFAATPSQPHAEASSLLIRP